MGFVVTTATKASMHSSGLLLLLSTFPLPVRGLPQNCAHHYQCDPYRTLPTSL